MKEDVNVQSNWHDRCGAKQHDNAEHEFKGVNDTSKGDKDLHNEWKCNHMISDELTTTENAKISTLKSARVAQLTEEERHVGEGHLSKQAQQASSSSIRLQEGEAVANARFNMKKLNRLRLTESDALIAQDEDQAYPHGFRQKQECASTSAMKVSSSLNVLRYGCSPPRMKPPRVKVEKKLLKRKSQVS